MNISTHPSFRSQTARSFAGAAAVLAATLGLSLLGPHRAFAAPHPSLASAGANDLGVTILSPDPNVPLSGVKPVEISAFYQGSPSNQIVAIELFIDGAKAATKTLDAPETRGVVSFLVDAGQIAAGAHQIVVRATAADQEVQSVKSRFTFNGMDPGVVPLTSPNTGGLTTPAAPTLSGGLPPTLRLFSPSPDGRVQGTVTLRVEASDPSGKAPYISLFIDKTFKTLRNYAPYEFEWDTTAYSNGYHTIEAYGYNDTPSVGHAKTLRLYVNNPGGETGIRHDLLDAAPVVKPIRRVSALPLVRPVQIALPKKPLSPARIAMLVPHQAPSTREIVREMTAGAGSLRFGALDFASELSAPSAAAKSAPASANAAPVRPARVQSFKPLQAADKTIVARPASDLEASALMAQTPARSFSQKARLPQIASIRLPGDELASPFDALPHASALSAPAFKAVKTLLRPASAPLKTHALRVHLPIGMMSDLLRSAGQRTLLFNSKTVLMDRPLTARNQVLFGPLRQIFEQGGGTLLWQSSTGTVRAKSASEDILLTLGDNHATVNAKQVTLDGKPYLMMGRTMVPLSFIAVAMDADVQFDAATGHLLVTSRK